MLCAVRRVSVSLLALAAILVAPDDARSSRAHDVAHAGEPGPASHDVAPPVAGAGGKIAALHPDVRRAIERIPYEVGADPASRSDGAFVYRARNRAQRVEATFTPSDFIVSGETAPGNAWSWGTRLLSIGYGSRQQPVAPATLAASGNRIEYRRGPLVEWYLNEPRGIEQGFTLEQRPGEREGVAPLTLELAFLGNLAPQVTQEGRELAFARPGGEVLLRYGELVAFDATGRAHPVRMELVHTSGPANPGLRLTVEDAAATYPLTIDPLVVASNEVLTASDGEGEDDFGQAVAISGETVVVGVQQKGEGGAAYVFRWNGLDWDETKLTAADTFAGDLFGNSVAASGDLVIVSAPGDDGTGPVNANQGAVYVFRWNGAGWDEEKLTASDGAAGDWFGFYSVAASGDVIVVGARYDDEARGAAYVFRWNGSSWDETKLTAFDGAEGDWFGRSVAISGDVIVVGAQLDDEARGAAYVFRWNGSSWDETRLVASARNSTDYFGRSVATSGDVVVVGSAPRVPGDPAPQYGAATVFRWDGTAWTLETTLDGVDVRAAPGSGGDFPSFSGPLAVSGDIILVAGRLSDSTDVVYVFQWDGSRWGLATKLTDTDMFGGSEVDRAFGSSIAVSGTSVVVGTRWDTLDDPMPGWAQVFELAEETTLTSGISGGRTGGRFGSSVSMAERWLAVGRPGSLNETGSVELFRRDGSQWVGEQGVFAQTTVNGDILVGDEEFGDVFGSSVSISDTATVGGRSLVVGAPGKDGDRGAAYVYRQNGALGRSWNYNRKLIPEGGAAPGDRFGESVAASGTHIVVGAPQEDAQGYTEMGAAYFFSLFESSSVRWIQRQKTSIPCGFWVCAPLSHIGTSVALSANRALVGAPGASLGGGMFPFYRYPGVETYVAYALHDPGGELGDGLGSSVATSGDWAVVGAPGGDTFRGFAWFYRASGSLWGAHQEVAPPGGPIGFARFGASAAISGDIAVVGAPGVDRRRGSAYVYRRDAADVWHLDRTLVPFTGAAGDEFGHAVAVYGNQVAVGAPHHNGNRGAVYVYDVTVATACNDGTDNDGDGFTDLDDPDCTDAAGTWEGRSVALWAASSATACGLGAELVLLLLPLSWLRARRSKMR